MKPSRIYYIYSKIIKMKNYLRVVYNPQKRTRNLLSTIGSLIPIAITIMFSIGIINLDTEGQQQFQLFAMNGWEAILAFIDAVTGMFMLFRMEDKSKIRTKYLKKAA